MHICYVFFRKGIMVTQPENVECELLTHVYALRGNLDTEDLISNALRVYTLILWAQASGLDVQIAGLDSGHVWTFPSEVSPNAPASAIDALFDTIRRDAQ